MVLKLSLYSRKQSAIYYSRILDAISFLKPMFTAFLAETVNLNILAKHQEIFINVYTNIEDRLELVILIMHFSNKCDFDFSAATMLAYLHNKRLRRIFEVDAISFSRSFNNQQGIFRISLYLGKVILNSYNIFPL